MVITDAGIRKRFNTNARYFKDMPGGPCYAIRVGSVHLFADDTQDLFKQFERECQTTFGLSEARVVEVKGASCGDWTPQYSKIRVRDGRWNND